MKCMICGDETYGSIGGSDICPTCDCGIGLRVHNGKVDRDPLYSIAPGSIDAPGQTPRAWMGKYS